MTDEPALSVIAYKSMIPLQALIVFISGALFSVAFPPVGIWILFIALVPLFVFSARAESARAAFNLGFWFGFGFFAFYIFWLPNSLSDFFGSAAWLMYPPIVLIEGVFWGLVVGLSRLLAGKYRASLWLMPTFWLIMEWARTQGALAFPWGSLGYIWIGTPVAQAADLMGSYGLSLLTLVMVALLAVPFVRAEEPAVLSGNDTASPLKTFGPVVLALVLASGSFAYGFYRLGQAPIEPDQTVLLVQGNTDPLGRAQGTTSDLDIYTGLTNKALLNLDKLPSLVVWPEGAVIGEPVTGMNGEATRKRIQEAALGTSVLTGASVWEDRQTRYNAAIVLEDSKIVSQYNKRNLVPFGEAAPFSQSLNGLYTVVYSWFNLLPSVTTPGTSYQPLDAHNLKAGLYICYESVFPQVAQKMVREGADVLINISNDTWFGLSNGAEQHFLMGSMRAIETRRYILRAGNDGITAIINSNGKVTQRLERAVASSLLGNFARNDAMTVYMRFGHLLWWLVGVYTVLASALLAIRRS